MKKGSIIRKQAHDGQPIGCYYIVNKIKKGFVYCYRLFQGTIYEEQEFLLLQNKTVTHDVLYMNITDKKAKSIIYNRQKPTIITHEVSKRWESIVENKPEIICFFDKLGNKRYITYDNARKVVTANGLYVVIYGINYI